MARRTIAVGLAEDVLRYGARQPWDDTPPALFRPDPRSYVSCLIDGSPYECLLWREIRQMQAETRMTSWQRMVFDCYLRGLSINQTAHICDRDRSTIHEHLQAAFAKSQQWKNRGVLTVMIETLGWSSVRESLHDKLEIKYKENRESGENQAQND